MQINRNLDRLAVTNKINQTNTQTHDFPISKSELTLGIKELVKARCSTNSSNTYCEWEGSVYAFTPQERPKKLFNIIGMNASRCLPQNDNKWLLVSREITLYLDPLTNEVLNYWQNPWTGETVPVVHVTLNPIQIILQGEYPAFVHGKNVTFRIDVPLSYPNVLGDNPKYQDYSPQKLYQAGEFFQYIVPIDEVLDPSVTSVKSFSGSWMRFGLWLPWMKMKDKPGQLIYNAAIKKFSDFERLSPVLRQLINSRLPSYKEAPDKFVPGRNETSWTYFHKHFEEYLQDKSFPISEPLETK